MKPSFRAKPRNMIFRKYGDEVLAGLAFVFMLLRMHASIAEGTAA